MSVNTDTTPRCGWATTDPIYIQYHDVDWGTPVHDDRKLFEMLSLEGAQAGLSWITILKRRETYKAAFDDFDARLVAEYDEARITSLLTNPGIIRNQLKVRSVVTNARAYLKVQAEFGTFDAYLWRFVNGEPILNCFATLADIPPKTPVSDAMSKDLKKRGFTFVGSTICYALMQSCGLVNDHVQSCFRYHCDN
ncbi:MAG: DNA-3-methyladenine glycosylase I [Anaerolineae bacterium]|nr:DNA-3-methyladenine glycosylase I [Anaerolineae bacterium]